MAPPEKKVDGKGKGKAVAITSTRVTRSMDRKTRSGSSSSKLMKFDSPEKRKRKNMKAKEGGAKKKVKKEKEEEEVAVEIKKEEESMEEDNPKEGEEEEADSEKKKIVIEHCKQCTSFKTRAEQVKEGLEEAVPGILVTVNPDKPRRGCFEIREEGGDTYISLLDMERPFTLMKELDMEEDPAEVEIYSLTSQIRPSPYTASLLRDLQSQLFELYLAHSVCLPLLVWALLHLGFYHSLLLP